MLDERGWRAQEELVEDRVPNARTTVPYIDKPRCICVTCGVPATAVLEPKPQAPELDDAVALFKALADPARLKILYHLHAQEPYCCAPDSGVCACDLEDVTGLSQPTVSHHMKVLTAAGLVAGEKRGRWMYYRVDPQSLELASWALSQLGG